MLLVRNSSLKKRKTFPRKHHKKTKKKETLAIKFCWKYCIEIKIYLKIEPLKKTDKNVIQY